MTEDNKKQVQAFMKLVEATLDSTIAKHEELTEEEFEVCDDDDMVNLVRLVHLAVDVTFASISMVVAQDKEKAKSNFTVIKNDKEEGN